MRLPPLQAASGSDDAAISILTPELLCREGAARAAVAALPALPSTSPHLVVRALAVPLAIRGLAAGLIGAIEVAPPPPAPHVHSPHCFHARPPRVPPPADIVASKPTPPGPSAMKPQPIGSPALASGVHAVDYPNGDRYEGSWCASLWALVSASDAPHPFLPSLAAASGRVAFGTAQERYFTPR